MRNIIRAAADRWRAMRDPVGFARSIGVKVTGSVHFYGINRAMFGSEPWMITIGDDVYITAGCQFVTHDGGTLILRSEIPDLEWSAPISVGNHVYVGVRTVVLPGVTIGDRVVIGACSVVTRDIPSNSVAVGCPARVIGTVDEYRDRLAAKSLKVGNLSGAEKDAALRKIFGAGTAGAN